MQQSPKAEQVGGSHYGTKYGHWDLCADSNMGYLEGSATKYIYRWRKKNGVEDLKKALSFVMKLIETNKGPRDIPKVLLRMYSPFEERFYAENDVKDPEKVIIETILQWETISDLKCAKMLLSNLINQEEHK